MSHPLDSAHAKLDRADQHLVALKKAVERFEGSNPYRVEIEPASEGGEFPIRLRVLQPAPVLTWGAVIGDVVYALRSALDHVVYALTIDHQRQVPPIPPNSKWRRTEFPIFKDEGKTPQDPGTWKNGAPNKLWGVSQSVYALIESYQPFRCGQQAATNHPLWFLQELSNLDKHRAIPTLGTFVVPRGVEVRTSQEVFGVPLPPGFPDDLTLTPIEVKTGPFEDGAPLGRVRLGGSLVVPVDMLPMYMKPEATIDVLLGQGTPAEGQPARPALIRARDYVRRIVERVEPEFRWTWR